MNGWKALDLIVIFAVGVVVGLGVVALAANRPRPAPTSEE
jgi:hypothetical protein